VREIIFVFGSNLAGRHGKGAALIAKQKYGAIQGVGEGLQNSSYAIPTKNARLEVLPYSVIAIGIASFLDTAYWHSELRFKITRIGCGLAGYKDDEIAPLFENAPDNCYFDLKWRPYLPTKKFWGTY